MAIVRITTEKKISDYLMVGLFILSSGSTLGFQNFIILNLFTIIFGAIRYYRMFGIRISKFQKPFFINLLLMIIITMVNQGSNSADINRFFLLISYILVGFFAISTIEKENFQLCFVNIIYMLALISILIWLLYLMDIVKLSEITILGSKYNRFFYNSYFDLRNSGIFWEPGAYQIFINFAIIFVFELEKAKKHVRNDKIKNIILYFTLLTTQSTTGYICFAIIFCYQFMFKYQNSKNKKAMIRYFLGVLVVFIVGIFILNSSVITNKFSTKNYSYNARYADLVASIELIPQKPILGYGYWSDQYIKDFTWATRRGVNNSSGIFVFTLFFGVPWMLHYLYAAWVQMKRRNHYTNKIFLILLFIIINMTECILSYPIYAYYIADFKPSENRKESK